MKQESRTRLLVIVTSATFAQVFLKEQMRFLSTQGFDVFLTCSFDEGYSDLCAAMPGHVFGISWARSIEPWKDVCAFLRLITIILRVRPEIVHTHTPKAGIIGMVGAWLTLRGNRVHTIHGLRSETLSGIRLKSIAFTEKCTIQLSTKAIAVSNSLRSEVLKRQLAAPRQVCVLGYGACAGVDLSIFRRRSDSNERKLFRAEHYIEECALVVAYVGRIAQDKGIATLGQAWLKVQARNPNAMLILAGPIDETDPIEDSILQMFRHNRRVRFFPEFITDVTNILVASDIAVQPSYREGLGMAALEASAMGLPVVASSVTGLTDAVIHWRTGLLVPERDPEALADAIDFLLSNYHICVAMGAEGESFVKEMFDRKLVSQNLLQFYRCLPRSKHRVKRLLDVVAATVGLIICSPVLVIAAILIWVSMGFPIIFKQQRAGFRGNTFTLFKLRTMRTKTDTGELNKDSQRLTALGRWLRKLSIDELPGLWNVLRGEMSLVGPRPLLAEYLPRYTQEQNRRHEVTPGITGWAQVHGRNTLSWEEKFALDVWYVDHSSILLDLWILLLTVKRVFSMSNINPINEDFMSEFVGRPSVR